MSQFNQPYEGTMTEPARTSGLAISALVCSLILCCPVTTALGIVLGIAAIFSIGSNPMKKGKGLAITAIILGIIFTPLTVWGGWWIGRMIQQVGMMMETGIPTGIEAGAGGDYAAFKSVFYGPGATAPDEQAQAFFEQLEQRYGPLQSVFVDEVAQQQQTPAVGQTTMIIPYIMQFEGEQISAEADLHIADPNTGQFIWKLDSFTVLDPDQGDLTYPPQGGAAPPTP